MKIFIVFISFFIINCQTIEKNELDIAIKWRKNIPHNVIHEKKRITLEYEIIPENQQEKYFEILENKSFTIIDEDEYLSLFGKPSSKKHIIAIRALAHSPVNNSELKQKKCMTVSLFVDKNVIYSFELSPFEGYSDDEFKKLSLHRIVLVIELDILPKDIYVMTIYDIHRNAGVTGLKLEEKR